MYTDPVCPACDSEVYMEMASAEGIFQCYDCGTIFEDEDWEWNYSLGRRKDRWDEEEDDI